MDGRTDARTNRRMDRRPSGRAHEQTTCILDTLLGGGVLIFRKVSKRCENQDNLQNKVHTICCFLLIYKLGIHNNLQTDGRRTDGRILCLSIYDCLTF